VRKDEPGLLFPGMPPFVEDDPIDASEVPTDALAFETASAEPPDASFGEETEADCAEAQTAHAKMARTHGVDRLSRIAHRRRRLSEFPAPFIAILLPIGGRMEDGN
jgi:hypothetical protein